MDLDSLAKRSGENQKEQLEKGNQKIAHAFDTMNFALLREGVKLFLKYASPEFNRDDAKTLYVDFFRKLAHELEGYGFTTKDPEAFHPEHSSELRHNTTTFLLQGVEVFRMMPHSSGFSVEPLYERAEPLLPGDKSRIANLEENIESITLEIDLRRKLLKNPFYFLTPDFKKQQEIIFKTETFVGKIIGTGLYLISKPKLDANFEYFIQDKQQLIEGWRKTIEDVKKNEQKHRERDANLVKVKSIAGDLLAPYHLFS